MAQYRFSSQVIGRSTGRSAVACAAYRAGASLADERTGVVHDFSRRHGILHAEVMAPENAPDWMLDRARLWNAVEAAEKRGDAQLSREVQLSLPHELTDDQRRELVRGFVAEQFVARGMIADLAIHAPGRQGDDRNAHAHIMLTMRELTGQGFGNKARDWNGKDVLSEWREQWAIHQNRELERHGHAARVDHRSYEAQGIDRAPTQHMGPTAHKMESRGTPSRIGDHNRQIDQQNADRADNHQKAAVINLAVERERRDFAPVAAQRVDQLQDALKLSWVDIDRNFQRQQLNTAAVLEQQYGTAKKTIAAELDAITARANATGWRRLVRSITGQAGRDEGRALGLQLTLGNIEQRERETVQALTMQQERARASIQQQQAAKVEKLKLDLEKEGRRREAIARRQQDKARRREVADRYAELKHGRRQPLPSKPEQQPVKDEFEKARRVEPVKMPAPAPTHPAYISRPAPAPSPAGETPRPAQKTLEQVPTKPEPMPPVKAQAAPQRDFKAQAAPTPPAPEKALTRAQQLEQMALKPAPTTTPEPQKAGQSRADYWNEQAQKQTPAKEQDRDRQHDRDRDFEPER